MKHVELNLRIKNKEDEYVIDLPNKEVGLWDVDRIRQELAVPMLRLERIYHKIPTLYDRWIYVQLNEFTARESGHFMERATVTMYVPKHFLNQFCDIVVHAERNEENGEVKEARLMYQFNKEKFLEWWKAAGYPLEVEEEKEEN